MGSYKVNSAYAAITDAREGGFSEELFCKISKLGVPPKVQCLMRRIFHHSFLPLKSNLTKRRIIIDHMLCPFCHSQEKSQQHLLFTCPASSQVWNTYYSWLNELTVLPSATAHFWQNMGCASSNREKKVMTFMWTVVVWNIWRMIVCSNKHLLILIRSCRISYSMSGSG